MLRGSSCKQFIFLDTDTIFVHDLIHDLRSDVISAKVESLSRFSAFDGKNLSLVGLSS